jgi:TPR repeat protein
MPAVHTWLEGARRGALTGAWLGLLAACAGPEDPDTLFRTGHYERSIVSAQRRADDPAALNLVGVHYYIGAGVERDFTEAGKWFERAARLGNADAQRNLGVLYLRGLGVRQNDFQAFAWFTEAAKRGNARATDYLAVMGDALTPTQVVRARRALDDEIHQRVAD